MAGLDASIYSQIQPTQAAPNPLAQMAQIAQIQRYQQDGEKDRRLLDMQDKRQAVLMSPEFRSATPQQQSQMVLGTGDVDGYGKLVTANAAASKDTRDAARIQFETSQKQREVFGGVLMQAAENPAMAQQLIMNAVEQGVVHPDYAAKVLKQASEAPDPTKFYGAGAMATADAIKQGELQYKQQTFAETGRHNRATEGIQADAVSAKRGEVVTAAAGKNREAEMKLGDDYRAQSKDFKAVADAYRTINTTLDSATTSPAATLAGATKFMKLLDPGSVVRESELGMALQASGVIDRATNYINILQSGKVLTPTQVKDFKGITEQIYSAAREGQAAVDADYTDKATRFGLDPRNVIQDLGPKTKAEKTAAAAKTVKRTGTLPDGRKVVEYSDGTTAYAN